MKTVIEMAREAWRDHPMYGGVDIPDPADYDLAALERFAALVREDEREACAKVCDEEGSRVDASWSSCAEAIRAKGE